MYNSRTYPPPPVYSVSIILISMVAGKSHKKPHHPSKVPAMNCLRPKPAASGFRFSPLHFKATLCSATFRSIPFIVIFKPRLPMQECFHSFHCAHTNPPFHSAPLWLFHPQPGTQSQNEKLHFTQSIRCIVFSHHPCFLQHNQW